MKRVSVNWSIVLTVYWWYSAFRTHRCSGVSTKGAGWLITQLLPSHAPLRDWHMSTTAIQKRNCRKRNNSKPNESRSSEYLGLVGLDSDKPPPYVQPRDCGLRSRSNCQSALHNLGLFWAVWRKFGGDLSAISMLVTRPMACSETAHIKVAGL